MRIAKLNLIKFGPFENLALDFGAGPGGLHLVYGPNEAGKSSALRALTYLLYGIPGQCSDNFRFPYGQLRIGAVLESGDGERLEIIRRKGNQKTLRGPDDNSVVDDAVLQSLLGQVDEPMFRRQFGIDHAELVQGGRQILADGGDLGESLFAAGSGLANFRKVREMLAEECNRLFTPRGKNPLVNDALSRFKDARKTVKEKTLTTAEWKKIHGDLQAAEKRKNELAERIAQLQVQQGRLQRFRDALPLITKRRLAESQLNELRDVPRLPDDFSERRRDAQSARERAAHALQLSDEAIQKLESELADLPEFKPELLNVADTISELFQQRGAIVKAAKDRGKLAIQLYEKEVAVKSALQDLGREVESPDAGTTQITLMQRRNVQNLGREREGLLKELESSERRLKEVTESLESKRRELDSIEPPHDTTELERAIARTLKAGDLEQNHRELSIEIESARQQAEVDLKQLGGFQGTLEQLEELATPSVETVERFDDRRSKLEQQRKSQAAKIEELQTEVQDIDQRLTATKLGQDVPTEQDLAASRQSRDAAWWSLRQILAPTDGNDRPEPSAEAISAQIREFEGHLESTDSIADRLRREADAVALKAELSATRQKLEKRLEDARQKLSATETEWKAWQSEWRDAWATAGIEPRSPREMRAWLSQRAALTKTAAELRSRTIEMKTVEQRIEELRSELLAQLEAMGQAVGGKPSLGDLLVTAQTLVQSQKKLQSAHRELRREIERLEREHQRTENELKAHREKWEKWTRQWAELMQSIDLEPSSDPEIADGYIDSIQTINGLLREIADQQERISKIDRDAEQFAKRTTAIIDEFGLDLNRDDAADSIARLYQLTQDARRASETKDSLTRRLEEERDRRRHAESELRLLNSTWQSLLQEAGCDADDALPEIERRSALLRDLLKEKGQIDERLAELAGGETIDELIAAASDYDIDQLEADLNRIDNELKELESERSSVLEDIGRLRNELQRMDGSGEAAEAQAEVNFTLSELRERAEDYARFRVAQYLLDRAVERYRDANQDPILTRASETFRRLTLNSFESLSSDFDSKGNAILQGVRPDGQRVPVSGMSEGTCDQLYLALRLAALEDYLDRNKPIPMVVDDILVMFDDDRAAAALKILADLGRRTQVIFFTHHQHLLDVAREQLDDDTYQVHRLADAIPTSAIA